MLTPNDLISYSRLAWNAVSGLWRFSQRNKRKLTAKEKLELRTKWKPMFADYLADHHQRDLRSDVIIRDMRRMDTYPDVTKTKGISAWFRVGLASSYERGIMVGLRWEGLTMGKDGFRYSDWTKVEQGERKVLLTGFIPYENIESVDWPGDDHYGFPHIYCYFTFSGEPYEKTAFCERHELDGWPFFTEVANADYNSVRKRSKKYGIVR